MTSHDQAGMPLVGRQAELDEIQELLRQLPERGSGLLVHGPAGIGKTALLQASLEMANQRGMLCLEATGLQVETNLPFAGLHQLVYPYLSRTATLTNAGRNALESAFGLDGTGSPTIFRVGLASLDLFAELSTDRPLLLLIEDGQWLDAASADVLAFISHRLEHEAILLLVAVRDGFASRIEQANLRRLPIRPLDPGASAELLDRHTADLVEAIRTLILEQAAGNPLALLELPKSAARGRTGVDAALPLTDRLQQAFTERLRVLSSRQRTVLAVAALDATGSLSAVRTAASRLLGEPVEASELSAISATGTLNIDGETLQFAHPLVRSAVQQSMAPDRQREIHTALATGHAGEPELSLWHRAAAAIPPNESLSLELEQSAAEASRKGASAHAAAALECAAICAESPERQGDLPPRPPPRTGHRGGQRIRQAPASVRRGLTSHIRDSVMPALQLAGTTALVTGASRGSGRAIAIALAKQGAHVAGVARDRPGASDNQDWR